MDTQPIIIREIRLQPYCLPFRQPFQTAYGVWRDRRGIVIQIIDDRGRQGLGEAAPLTGFGMETLAEAQTTLEQMRDLFVGIHLSNLKDLWNLLQDYCHTPAAKHGMELALLDLLAQSHLSPLAQYLNFELPPFPTSPSIQEEERKTLNRGIAPTACWKDVPVNATVGAMSLEATERKVLELLGQGYRCLKLKVGLGDFEQDWQRLKAVRAIAGEQIQIRIDANQAWSVEQAIANLTRLESLHLEYVEQPVTATDLAGMARVRHCVDIAIAADESVTSLQQLEQIIALQAADLVVLKPMAMGGILATLQAAHRAFEYGLDVVVTTTLDGAIARQGALHLAASLQFSRRLNRACGLATGNLLESDLCAEFPQPQSGLLLLSETYGLGIEKLRNFP
ncbi:o-succinylbenzoate synthase [Tumidithrix elongata RA019]|uniref:o-succinylbenzoate synthase n=1 Tax=Tumidithrix elongata BACA0141 TaxID=2716417 RepID=A0AAW9PR69_9CYAN|nr:o-succinylbenzoate synthase [Tumidithrix elongata RA019]